jgi:hypothetical protein
MTQEKSMFQPLIVLGLFGGVVWVISHAIFMLMHGECGASAACGSTETLKSFVEQNYGSRFVAENRLEEEGLRRL